MILFYSVTPLLQISTLNPGNVSNPFAISGGWKAGVPWPVLQVSSFAKKFIIWKYRKTDSIFLLYILCGIVIVFNSVKQKYILKIQLQNKQNINSRLLDLNKDKIKF